jgi:hypothetical protein
MVAFPVGSEDRARRTAKEFAISKLKQPIAQGFVEMDNICVASAKIARRRGWSMPGNFLWLHISRGKQSPVFPA